MTWHTKYLIKEVVKAILMIAIGLSLIYGCAYLLYTYDGWKYHPWWYGLPNALLTLTIMCGGFAFIISGIAKICREILV